MADLGIHGFPSRPDEVDEADHTRAVLEGLPDAFSTVWLSDHLQLDGEPFSETWTRLTWLAATLPRFRVGTMVLGQSYRNPGLLGTMAATLQNLSGGRLILGLGAGWLEEEYRAFHYDYPSGATRVAQLGEAIELLKALWTGEPCLLPRPLVPPRGGGLREASLADPDHGRQQRAEGAQGRGAPRGLVGLGWSLGGLLSRPVRTAPR